MQTQLLPHQARVITEKTDLDEKISKLGTFLNSDSFLNLNIVERGQLHRQYAAMSSYSKILDERIALF
jgi:hypothetical protein